METPGVNFIRQCFRTQCFISISGTHLQRWNRYLPVMEQCSETLAYKIQMPAYQPEGSIQHSQNGKSFKSRKNKFLYCISTFLY
jgi:hypothetical protein